MDQTIKLEAIAVQTFRPDLGPDRMPSAENGNAFASLPRIEAGDVLPPDHELVRAYPNNFIQLPAGLNPDVRGEIVALKTELGHVERRLAATGPETCPTCLSVHTRTLDRLAARADDLKATIEAHGVL